MPTTPAAPRPASPWAGSLHATRHRWQLDHVITLAEATVVLDALAAELVAAHEAGWWLVQPVRDGHVEAARPSRRRRAGAPPVPALDAPAPRPERPWRLRVVDEPPTAGWPRLDVATAHGSPVVEWTGGSLEHVRGPWLPVDVLARRPARRSRAHL